MVRMAPQSSSFSGPVYTPQLVEAMRDPVAATAAYPLPAPTPPQAPTPEREDLTQQRETLKTIRALLDGLCMVLAPRALLFIALLAVFALFMVALFIGEVKLLVAAGVFGMIIFFPTAFLYMKG